MLTEIKTRKWGNSIGFVIPAEIVEKLKIKTGESVLVDIQKKENVLKELFGSLKSNKATNKIIEEVRSDLEGRWLR
mgnify:CR=1 FL=1